MPKAAMNHNDLPLARKDDIRFTWKPSVVEAVPKAFTCEDSANCFLRSSVGGLHGLHRTPSSSTHIH